MSIIACTMDQVNEKNLENGEGPEVDEKEYELTEDGIITPEVAQGVIEQKADKLIQAISEKDTEIIGEFTHPVKGVRFTPYTYVSLEQDRVFSKEKVENFFKDQNIYLWGYYDGIGDEISLTPSEYYEDFIYSQDFKNAEKVGYNEVLSSGNMMENQFEVYENPIIVEYYFSGFDEKYAGIDWKSLRLVFEQYQNDWKLVGIIHNQWTI
jgi:hypothetical protein